MSWHLRSLVEKCAARKRRASEQLYNSRNSPGEVYCARHAKAALRRAQEREANA